MIRVLQSLLALISLLFLAFLAARAQSAECQGPEITSQNLPSAPAEFAGPRLRSIHRLVPAPQPGTHLQDQPFAYGYFGARAQPAAAFHRSYDHDWFQWSISRAN